jgi:hypothetical protein
MFKAYYTAKVLTSNKKNVKIWLRTRKRIEIKIPEEYMGKKYTF